MAENHSLALGELRCILKSLKPLELYINSEAHLSFVDAFTCMCKCVQKGVPVEIHLRHLRSWKQELICPRDTKCPRLEIKRDVDIQRSVHCSSIPNRPTAEGRDSGQQSSDRGGKHRKGLRRRRQATKGLGSEWQVGKADLRCIRNHMAHHNTMLGQHIKTAQRHQPQRLVFSRLHLIDVGVADGCPEFVIM